MKNLTISVFVLLLLSCKPTVQESSSTMDSSVMSPDNQVSREGDELHDADYGIYHFAFTINKSLPGYGLKIQLPEKKLFIFNNADESGDPIQTLSLGEDINHDEGFFAKTPEANFNQLDYNFDGFKDLSIVRVAGTGNTLLDIYLFDSSTKKFIKHEMLSELTSPEPDSVNHLVRYHNSGGMGGAWYTAGIIEWKNNQTVVTQEEEQTSLEGSTEIFIRTIQVHGQNGAMKLASKVQIQQAEGNKEKQCLLEGEWTAFDRFPNFIFAESKDMVIKVDGRNGSCN